MIMSSLIIGKARVTLKKFESILRLELVPMHYQWKYQTLSRETYSCKNLINIPGHTVELRWGTLLMIQEHAGPSE